MSLKNLPKFIQLQSISKSWFSKINTNSDIMPTVATSSHRLGPPRGARPSMTLRLLPPAVSPSPAPVCPSPATIKGRGAPPGHHHTHLALNRLLLSPQIVPHRRPVMSDPPPPSLAAGEAHRRPLSFFPQPR
jgi:hypothetical protein